MSSSGRANADWLPELIEHLIAARPPMPLSSVAGKPLIEGGNAPGMEDTFRRFSLALPWVELVVPQERHTTDCNSMRVRLDGIRVDGVSMDTRAFKSGQRVLIDCLQVDIQPKGRKQPIPFIPPTHNVRGTTASLAVHSPGYENTKSQMRFALPCLTMRFCPSVYGALMQLMGYSKYFLHETQPPWQQQAYSLNEFYFDLDEMSLVLFDEDPATTAVSSGGGSSGGGGGGDGKDGWGWLPSSQILPASGLLPTVTGAAQHVKGGSLGTMVFSRVHIWALAREEEYRLKLNAGGAEMKMDVPSGFTSSDTVATVNATLSNTPKEPGSPRRFMTKQRWSSGIFRSPPPKPARDASREMADALRIAVRYDMMPTRSSPEIKCALLELGETNLLWDTASSQQLLSHLYRCLSDGFLPQAPWGANAPEGDPFHTKVDVWDARITMQSLMYRLADAASTPRDPLLGAVMGPSVLGAMSFGECDIRVRLPWEGNVTVHAVFDVRALYAAVDGHETIPAYEEAAERTGDHFWMLGLNELLRPRDASESQVVYAYESYNEYTEIKPIDHSEHCLNA